MRAHSRALVGGACAAVLVLGLTGCASDGANTNPPTATAGTSGVQVEVNNTVNYGSFGTTADIDCADGKSLNVGGSNNTLTVKGTCTAVNISGADNKVTFDKVDKDISVVGFNNTVSYKDGDPKVNDLGSGNAIKKG
ncbi:MAG: hypothetical protein JWP55_1034 [Mycobacterium sp.]|jgi:uncharacterized membrane protein|nr:hypothetical protein [Mycobacterium sp.]